MTVEKDECRESFIKWWKRHYSMWDIDDGYGKAAYEAWQARAALDAKPAATQGEIDAVGSEIARTLFEETHLILGDDQLQHITLAAIAAMPKAQPVQAEKPDQAWDETRLIILCETLADLVEGGRPYLGSMAALIRPHLRLTEQESPALSEEEKRDVVEWLGLAAHDAVPSGPSYGDQVRARGDAALSALLERYEIRRKP